jgi:hypothetical protein
MMADSGRILTLWSLTDNLWKRIKWLLERTIHRNRLGTSAMRPVLVTPIARDSRRFIVTTAFSS